MPRPLSRRPASLAVGLSSGANVIGAPSARNELGPNAVVVTVLSDSTRKYLGTGLLKTEAVKDGCLSPDVVLSGCRAFTRVCVRCCD